MFNTKKEAIEQDAKRLQSKREEIQFLLSGDSSVELPEKENLKLLLPLRMCLLKLM
jgi:hypothetical protein